MIAEGWIPWLAGGLVAVAALAGLGWVLDASRRPRYREQPPARWVTAVTFQIHPTGLHAWEGEASWSPADEARVAA